MTGGWWEQADLGSAEDIKDTALAKRLYLAGCPITLDEILATACATNLGLSAWVRTSIGQGVMFRTAQSERIAAGRSVEATARMTGVSVEQVLYYLTLFEADEAVATDFYGANGGEM